MPLTEEERQFRNFLFDLVLMFKGMAESGCTFVISWILHDKSIYRLTSKPTLHVSPDKP
jgi:hypothetical protein